MVFLHKCERYRIILSFIQTHHLFHFISVADCTASNSFKCSSHSGDVCILATSQCDETVYDCPKHEDELNCRKKHNKTCVVS